MRIFTLLLLFGAVSPSLAISLNPLDWFAEVPENFAEPTAEEVSAAEALMESAAQAEEKGKMRRAIRTWKKVTDDYGNTAMAADALFYRASALMAGGDRKGAFEVFQTLVNRYPGHERFDEVIAAQYEIAVGFMDGERGRILGFLPGFKEPRTSIEYFEVLIRNAPYSSYAPTSLMNIALTAVSIGDKELAIDALDRLITFYPRSLLTADAYFTLAQIFASLIDGPSYDQGTTLEAMNYYQDFLILFPQSRFVENAESGLMQVRDIHARSRLVMGEYYYVHAKNDEAAKTYFNATITVAPESEAADFARERLARIENGEPRPFFSSNVNNDRLMDSVDSFFKERWEAYDAADAAAQEATRVRDRNPF
ncbi:MAG: tetratricopeptide repeat protein [Puniceicoccaceae bacterium]